MPIPNNKGRKLKPHERPKRTNRLPMSEEQKAKVAYYINAYLFSQESSFMQFINIPKRPVK